MPENMLAVPKLQIQTSDDFDNETSPSTTRHSRSSSTVSGTSLLSLPTTTPGGLSSASKIIFTDTEALRPDPGTEKDFQVEDNPFAFSPGQLNKLLNPKSLQAFFALGGTTRGLRADIDARLGIDEGDFEGKVTFEEAVEYKKTARDCKKTPSKNVPERHEESFYDRTRVFGENVIPGKKATPLWKQWRAKVDQNIEPPERCQNGRRGVKGIVNGQDIWAFGDTGAGQNIISSRRVKEMGLKIKHQPTLLRMGNSNQIASHGIVRFPWTFPDEPLKVINIVAHVLDDFKYGCLLGNPFLRFTQLMTKNIHRFVKGVFPSHNLWSLNLLGETSQRVQGSLGNNVPMEALADIGSARNVMNAAWAKQIGFTIRTGPENRGLIVFPDNSTQATIGQVHTTITLPGGQFTPIIFEVLPDCYVDVVLGEDFVFDNNLFTRHADSIYEAEGIDGTYDLLPMDFEEFSLAKVGSSARGLLRRKHKHNAEPANKSLSEREEFQRAKEWDSKYQQGRTASQVEWDAENKSRIEHEKRLFPTWRPDEQTCLIKFRPSTNSSVDTSIHATTASLSSGSSQCGNSLVTTSPGHVHPNTTLQSQTTSLLTFHDPETPSSSAGHFGAEEASFWGS